VNKSSKREVKRLDEGSFVKALKRGEEWAYERLYSEYAPKIGGIAKSYLGYDDVEDVVQEVMMRIYKGIKKFRGDSKLSTWIHRIAVNVCKDYLEKRNRRKEILTSFPEDNEEENMVAEHPSVENNVVEEVVNEMNHEKIMNLMNKLSEENRLLIKLRDIDGKSYEEIAEMLGKPVGTVKSRLHYARKKLRELLEGGVKDVER
jgi:RNA polymerase sigma-70 factor (ECF subfamily)